VKPTLFLRIASVLTLIHSVLHTVGGVLSAPTHGAEEIAVLDAMKFHSFNFMGSMRSYWDFHMGYGLLVTISLLTQAVLFWQLSTLAKTDALGIRPIVALFCLGYVGFAIVAWNYFFIAPAVTELLIALCLGLAFALVRPVGSA